MVLPLKDYIQVYTVRSSSLKIFPEQIIYFIKKSTKILIKMRSVLLNAFAQKKHNKDKVKQN